MGVKKYSQKGKDALKRIFHVGKKRSNEFQPDPVSNSASGSTQPQPGSPSLLLPDTSNSLQQEQHTKPQARVYTTLPSPATPRLQDRVATGAEEQPSPEYGASMSESPENEAPESKLLDIRIIASISTIWDEAYDQLSKNKDTASLIANYQQVLAKSGVDQDREDRVQKQMEDLIKNKTEEVEKGTWKLGFSNSQFAVKDLVQSVASIVEWAKDFVGGALQTCPPASIAWAGVCLLLPLLLKPGQQEQTRLNGLDEIASIIRECSLRETRYQDRYESPEGSGIDSRSAKAHNEYRECIKSLYSEIIRFQATYVCFLSEHNTAARLARDTVDWSRWSEMLQNITQKHKQLKSFDQQWRDFEQQNEWGAVIKQHIRGLERLDALGTEMKRFRELTLKAQSEEERSQILSWLQTVKPSVHYDLAVKSRRNHATGEWILQSNIFKDWKEKPNTFLWVIGKAGAGKSVLSSTIIDHLEGSHLADPYTALAYFYIKASDKPTRNVNNLMKSLITQLFGRQPETPDSLRNLGKYRDTVGAPPQSKFEEALWSVAKDFTRTYVVIDGLDECPASGDHGSGQGERRVLLELLTTMQGWGLNNLHVLVTSRREQDISDALRKVLGEPQGQVLDLSSRGYSSSVSGDIGLFIDEELKRGLFADLPADLKRKIKEDLISRADGVYVAIYHSVESCNRLTERLSSDSFHYASLQLDSFPSTLTPNSVEETLKNLPKGLYETYEKSLTDRLRRADERRARRALTWIAFSLVPLTIAELASAVSIPLSKGSNTNDGGTKENDSVISIDRGERFYVPKQVLSLLPGLHELQDTEGTGRGKVNPDESDNLKSNQAVVLPHFTLLEYLTSEDIKKPATQQFALNKTMADLQLAEACLLHHIHVSQEGLAVGSSKLREDYPLSEYAACYGLRHAENVGRAAWSNSLRQLIRRVLKDESESFAKLKLYSGYPSSRAHALPIHYAVDKRLVETIEFLFEEKLVDVNARLKGEGTPLIQAANNMDKEMAELLLKHDADISAKTEAGETVLHWAAHYGNKSQVQLFLDSGADVNAKTERGETPLHWATANHNGEVVHLLLKEGADVDASTDLGETPLHLAAKTSDDGMLKVLLDHGANINASNKIGETALFLVSRNL